MHVRDSLRCIGCIYSDIGEADGYVMTGRILMVRGAGAKQPINADAMPDGDYLHRGVHAQTTVVTWQSSYDDGIGQVVCGMCVCAWVDVVVILVVVMTWARSEVRCRLFLCHSIGFSGVGHSFFSRVRWRRNRADIPRLDAFHPSSPCMVRFSPRPRSSSLIDHLLPASSRSL